MQIKWTFIFPDGLVIEGFKWSIFGYYFKDFPQSGLRSNEFNTLKYSKQGVIDAGIKMEEE